MNKLTDITYTAIHQLRQSILRSLTAVTLKVGFRYHNPISSSLPQDASCTAVSWKSIMPKISIKP